MLPVSGESMALKVVPSCHPGTYFTVFMATVEQILTNVLYLQIPLKNRYFWYKNIARIANAVQVTICLLVSTSVY